MTVYFIANFILLQVIFIYCNLLSYGHLIFAYLCKYLLEPHMILKIICMRYLGKYSPADYMGMCDPEDYTWS